MKTTLKIFLAAAALFIATGSASAQQKFGYINMQELITAMPETDSADKALQAYQQELGTEYQNMTAEFAKKSEELRNNSASYTEVILKQKNKDLETLANNIQEFEQSAQQEIQKKQMEMLQPIIKKANDTIAKIAKEQNLVFVVDLSTNAFPFYNESMMVNMLPLVKKALNITK